MIIRKMDMQYNKSRIITAILKVVATAELYDPDATEETIRYCVEQDLEDVGFDVSVELLKEQETHVSIVDTKIVGFPQGDKEVFCCGDCKSVLNDSFGFCPFCGAKLDWSEQRGAVKWDD